MIFVSNRKLNSSLNKWARTTCINVDKSQKQS